MNRSFGCIIKFMMGLAALTLAWCMLPIAIWLFIVYLIYKFGEWLYETLIE